MGRETHIQKKFFREIGRRILCDGHTKMHLQGIYKAGDAKDYWQTPEIRKRQRMIPF